METMAPDDTEQAGGDGRNPGVPAAAGPTHEVHGQGSMAKK